MAGNRNKLLRGEIIIESLRSERTSKIIKSSRQPNATTPAKPRPEALHLHGFC